MHPIPAHSTFESPASPKFVAPSLLLPSFLTPQTSGRRFPGPFRARFWSFLEQGCQPRRPRTPPDALQWSASCETLERGSQDADAGWVTAPRRGQAVRRGDDVASTLVALCGDVCDRDRGTLVAPCQWPHKSRHWWPSCACSLEGRWASSCSLKNKFSLSRHGLRVGGAWGTVGRFSTNGDH